jgi:serine/threonine protein kinase
VTSTSLSAAFSTNRRSHRWGITASYACWAKALKVLRDAWLSPARRRRFEAEQRTLASLNHPSIARLYDAGALADGTPWFVMEYVDGVPLNRYCRRNGLNVAERLKLFREVCEAVRHAHEHSIIHRDLKPSNILVKGDGAVRLLDFGIAKHLSTAPLGADQTRTGMRLMTPGVRRAGANPRRRRHPADRYLCAGRTNCWPTVPRRDRGQHHRTSMKGESSLSL